MQYGFPKPVKITSLTMVASDSRGNSLFESGDDGRSFKQVAVIAGTSSKLEQCYLLLIKNEIVLSLLLK
jgi:hypothetical protein